MNKPIIIGAGITGLSAANHFVDNGIFPIIIDSDVIGRTKVCGEFFSYESIPFLKKWNIPFLEIKKANFNINNKKYSFDLPLISASTSRSVCEEKLANRAEKLGAKFYSQTFVEEIIPAKLSNDQHQIKLKTGQAFETNKLIITTSKLPSIQKQKKLNSQYVGIKAHFTNIDMPNELNMYLIKDAYMGLTYIDASTVNICCLAKKEEVDKYKSVDDFMDQFFLKNNNLKNIYKSAKKLNENWLTVSIDQFGKKNIPDWQNTYFIGDAVSTIYPASGNGLAMGLTSGIMAVDHIIKNSQYDFKNLWQARYESRLSYARLLHSFFMSEKKATLGLHLASLFPGIANYFYKFTRDY